jgi:hypothetical protein
MARHAKNEDDGGDSRGFNLIIFCGSPSGQDSSPDGGVLTQQIKAAGAFLAAVAALIAAIVGHSPSNPEKQAPGERLPPKPPYSLESATPSSEKEAVAAQNRPESPVEEKRSSSGQKPEPESSTTTTTGNPELTTTSEIPTTSEHTEPTTTTTTTETTTSTPPPGENERPHLLAAAGSILLGELEPAAPELPETSTTVWLPVEG